MELPFTEARDLGRQVLKSGDLRSLQDWFSLSDTRLAMHLRTNTASLHKWFEDHAHVDRMHDTTAARIGQWSYTAGTIARDMLDRGVRVSDLYPLNLLAGQMGRSVNSLLYTQMCQEGEITCYDLGPMGVYIARDEVEKLREGAGR